MTRSSTPCSSIWEAGRVCRTRPSEMTRTVSARPSTSSISLETTTIGVAGRGEAPDEGVDLGAGADVDTARGLVEQQDARAVHEPAREEDLLLVAARQRPRLPVGVGRSQLERLDLLARDLPLGALVEEAGLREPRHRREGDVDEDRLVEHEALALALLGREADPRFDGGHDRAAAQLLAADPHRAGGRLARAVDGLEDLGATGADEARRGRRPRRRAR